MADDPMTAMSKDIEYIKKSVDEIKAGQSSQINRIREIELTQERHKTYFLLIGGALTAIGAFLAGAASGLIGLFR
jgi:hypothetical protein